MHEKKNVNVELGKRIKSAREAAGLTQERFAELVGMGTKNISAIERGIVGISISSLIRICDVLSVSSDSLLFDGCKSAEASRLTSKLEGLSEKQFGIAKNIINNVIEAFSTGE